MVTLVTLVTCKNPCNHDVTMATPLFMASRLHKFFSVTMNSYGQNRGMKRKANVLLERPKEVGIMQYAQSRANEIEALAEEIKKNTGARKVFQSLPIHMRRRAMSHNIKRLPRRLQNIARKEYDKITSNPKRPSRRHRRRPKNLLEEYQRRQRKHIWLETHIWHAKRFKMEDRWGYRIPLHSTDKSIKACYRATQNYCQIQVNVYIRIKRVNVYI
ncbi:POP1 [Mytilus edulis]|uniref:POP1 n=1 Tax=Mytilus edulis TaxID=6550 RepID=A0A8S3U2C4_MYTED|nr:POP1 [Mytilus edulis]